MYHVIIIDRSLKDEAYLSSLKVFAQKIDGDWTIYGVEVKDDQLEKFILEIQANLKPNQPWYVHAYRDQELIVIFEDKIIKASPDALSWQPILSYGRKLGIPHEQLNFYPNRFQDESHYFPELG